MNRAAHIAAVVGGLLLVTALVPVDPWDVGLFAGVGLLACSWLLLCVDVGRGARQAKRRRRGRRGYIEIAPVIELHPAKELALRQLQRTELTERRSA